MYVEFSKENNQFILKNLPIYDVYILIIFTVEFHREQNLVQ